MPAERPGEWITRVGRAVSDAYGWAVPSKAAPRPASEPARARPERPERPAAPELVRETETRTRKTRRAFKQGDVNRAVHAAQAAGVAVGTVPIDRETTPERISSDPPRRSSG